MPSWLTGLLAGLQGWLATCLSLYLLPSQVAGYNLSSGGDTPILSVKTQGKALCVSAFVCMLFYVYIYICVCSLVFQWQHFGSPIEFFFAQRSLSLRWTVKCCNLFLLEPDGSWMGVKIAAAMIHGLSPCSPWDLLFCSISLQELLHYHSGKWKMLCRNVGEENADYRSYFPTTKIKSVPREPVHWMSLSLCDVDVLFLFHLLPFYYCACFPVGLWRFSFHRFLLRCPDFRAGGLWDQGCRSKNQ